MFAFDHASRNANRPQSFAQSAVADAQRKIARYYQEELRKRTQTDPPPVWKLPLGSDVIAKLTALSHGKCPFCERLVQPLQPHRFRPPAYAAPMANAEEKQCYLWLTFTWSNLFPICLECLPTNRSYFPVDGPRAQPPSTFGQGDHPAPGEQAVLFHPGEPSLKDDSFSARLDGELAAGNRRAKETIRTFKLNRRDLTTLRKKAFADLLDRLRNSMPQAAPFFPDLQRDAFGGSQMLLLKRLANELARSLGGKPTVTRRGFASWRKNPQFLAALDDALEALRGEDDPSEASEALEEAVGIPPPGDAPRISKVTIRNYKSLENIEFTLPDKLPPPAQEEAATLADESTPCLLILGENATGKSSILEAIALACVDDTQRGRLGLKSGELTLDPEFFGAPKSRRKRECSISVAFHDATVAQLSISAGGTISSAVNNPATRLPPVFAYGANRLPDKVARLDRHRHVETLFSRYAAISNPEEWLIDLDSKDQGALHEVVSALRHVIQIDGEFETIEVLPDVENPNRKRCFINIKRKRRLDGRDDFYTLRQRLGVASSGYQALLALVCDVFQGMIETTGKPAYDARNSSAIVLIDEIEAHLHPRWKLQIISRLRQVFPKMTFIITSHDPLCVRGMHNGEVMMMNRFQNDGRNDLPETVEPVMQFEDIEKLTIEQILTSDLFQLLSTDDRRIDGDFAQAADALAKRKARLPLTNQDKAVLEKLDNGFSNRIRDALPAGVDLPYGSSEVTRIIQESIAEYLAERRRGDSESASAARKKAKKKVQKFLMELLQ